MREDFCQEHQEVTFFINIYSSFESNCIFIRLKSIAFFHFYRSYLFVRFAHRQYCNEQQNWAKSNRIIHKFRKQFQNKTQPNKSHQNVLCIFSSCNLILGSDEMVIFKCLITYVRYPNEVIQCKPNQVRILFLLVSDNGYWNIFAFVIIICTKANEEKKEVRHEAIATKLELEQPRHISVLSNLPA